MIVNSNKLIWLFSANKNKLHFVAIYNSMRFLVRLNIITENFMLFCKIYFSDELKRMSNECECISNECKCFSNECKVM